MNGIFEAAMPDFNLNDVPGQNVQTIFMFETRPVSSFSFVLFYAQGNAVQKMCINKAWSVLVALWKDYKVNWNHPKAWKSAASRDIKAVKLIWSFFLINLTRVWCMNMGGMKTIKKKVEITMLSSFSAAQLFALSNASKKHDSWVHLLKMYLRLDESGMKSRLMGYPGSCAAAVSAMQVIWEAGRTRSTTLLSP